MNSAGNSAESSAGSLGEWLPLADADFERFVKEVESLSTFSDSKTEYITRKYRLSDHGITCAQLAELLSLVLFADERVSLAQDLITRCTDLVEQAESVFGISKTGADEFMDVRGIILDAAQQAPAASAASATVTNAARPSAPGVVRPNRPARKITAPQAPIHASGGWGRTLRGRNPYEEARAMTAPSGSGSNPISGNNTSVPLSTMTPKTHRALVLREIVDTELSYVSDLETVMSLYYLPIVDSGMLSQSEISSIFSNIQSIVPLHKRILHGFMEAVDEAQGNEDEVCVGDVFLEMADYLKMYTEYCTNQPLMVETLQAVSMGEKKSLSKADATSASYIDPKLKSKFGIFLDTLCQDREKNPTNLNLFAYLIKPVQRLCKYPLFLEQLLKDTKEDHIDHQALTQALAKINHMVDYVNERKRHAENLQRTLEIQRRLEGNSSIVANLVMPSRKFVAESTVKTFGEKQKGKPRLAKIFVFNDLIVLGIPEEKRKGLPRFGSRTESISPSSHFRVRCAIPMADLRITDVADDAEWKNCWQCTARSANDALAIPLEEETESSFFAMGTTPEDKRTWLTNVKKLLRDFQISEAKRLKEEKDNKAMQGSLQQSTSTVSNDAVVPSAKLTKFFGVGESTLRSSRSDSGAASPSTPPSAVSLPSGPRQVGGSEPPITDSHYGPLRPTMVAAAPFVDPNYANISDTMAAAQAFRAAEAREAAAVSQSGPELEGTTCDASGNREQRENQEGQLCDDEYGWENNDTGDYVEGLDDFHNYEGEPSVPERRPQPPPPVRPPGPAAAPGRMLGSPPPGRPLVSASPKRMAPGSGMPGGFRPRSQTNSGPQGAARVPQNAASAARLNEFPLPSAPSDSTSIAAVSPKLGSGFPNRGPAPTLQHVGPKPGGAFPNTAPAAVSARNVPKPGVQSPKLGSPVNGRPGFLGQRPPPGMLPPKNAVGPKLGTLSPGAARRGQQQGNAVISGGSPKQNSLLSPGVGSAKRPPPPKLW